MHYFAKNEDRLHSNDQESAIYLEFDSLSGEKHLLSRVFTRKGGVSKGPYESLNVGFNTGDDAEKVQTNLRIIQENTGIHQIIMMDQVHGDNIVSVKNNPAKPFKNLFRCDALITDIPQCLLMVRQADCQGIILFDRKIKVVSVIHSGWRGSVLNIAGKAVMKMVEEYKCDPVNILAAVGPSLGPCCAEFVSYQDIFPESFKRFMVRPNYFDLWALTRSQLRDSGVPDKNIEISSICTRCRSNQFYSYRAENVTGRFATVAMIKK